MQTVFQALTHTRAHTHTCARAHAHARTHTNARTHARTHNLEHKHTHTHTHTHTHNLEHPGKLSVAYTHRRWSGSSTGSPNQLPIHVHHVQYQLVHLCLPSWPTPARAPDSLICIFMCLATDPSQRKVIGKRRFRVNGGCVGLRDESISRLLMFSFSRTSRMKRGVVCIWRRNKFQPKVGII